MDNNNLNIDNDTMNQIKNLVNGGNISDALSKIPPEMIQNFSNMMNSNSQNNGQNNNNPNNSQNGSGQNSIPNFDLNNIDMNTNKNDPRANLLNSLKPYLRDNKKEKLDSYVNLLNMSKIAEVLKNTNNNKENNNE